MRRRVRERPTACFGRSRRQEPPPRGGAAPADRTSDRIWSRGNGCDSRRSRRWVPRHACRSATHRPSLGCGAGDRPAAAFRECDRLLPGHRTEILSVSGCPDATEAAPPWQASAIWFPAQLFVSVLWPSADRWFLSCHVGCEILDSKITVYATMLQIIPWTLPVVSGGHKFVPGSCC